MIVKKMDYFVNTLESKKKKKKKNVHLTMALARVLAKVCAEHISKLPLK